MRPRTPSQLCGSGCGSPVAPRRRGAAEQLTQISIETYTGNGYALTLSGDRSQPDGFVLSLDRASELPYARR